MAMTPAIRPAARPADVLVYNRPALIAWHAALANRASAPARIVWLGDSIVEGTGAASYGTRWVDRALASLRAAYPTLGVTGGFGYLPGGIGGPSSGTPWTAKTSANAYGLDGFGLGARTAVLGAAGDGLTYTVQASSFQVHYVKAGGLGTLSIQVDGGTPTTIATAGGLGVNVWTSPALTPGQHTVTITSAGGGTVYFCGIAAFNGDEAAGIQGYEAGHYGWNSSQLVNAGGFYYSAIGTVAPHLVTLAVGTNDYPGQVPVATYRANLQAIVAAVRAQVPAASIALIGYARRGDVAVQPIGWAQYVQALYDVADADTGGVNGRSGVAVIDLSARLPDAAVSGTVDSIGVNGTDRVHYSAKGHLLIGEAVAGALRA